MCIRDRYGGLEQGMSVYGRRVVAVDPQGDRCVVRELAGVERPVHPPGRRVDVYKRQTLLKKGLCIAIEPMITQGDRQVIMERDGWTVRTRDRKCAAHFEHTIAVGAGEADILSRCV